MVKSRGRATKHVIEFDDGTSDTLLLSKDPTEDDGKMKGTKFYLVDEEEEELVAVKSWDRSHR